MFMWLNSRCAHHPVTYPRVIWLGLRAAPTQERMDRRGILALAHRGVIHVRGKDCVQPDIGLVFDHRSEWVGQSLKTAGTCEERP
jgi:hypothetical protein